MKNNQKGVSSLELLIIILGVGLIIGSGFFIAHKNAVAHCNSTDCFNKKFARCSPAIYKDRATTTNQTAVKFQIYGKEDSGCRMSFEYTANPDKTLVNQTMTCDFNNTTEIQDALLAVFYSFYNGLNSYKCTGPLVGIEQKQLHQMSLEDHSLIDYTDGLAAKVAEYMSDNQGQPPADLSLIRNATSNSAYKSWQEGGPITQGAAASSTFYYASGYACDENTKLMIAAGSPHSTAIVTRLSSGKPYCADV